jgi:hypothetical protein
MKTLFPPAEVAREKVHTRHIHIEGFRRIDGLWDIEGHITDVKDVEHRLLTHDHPPGMPIHEMCLRITVDDTLTIVEAQAVTHAAPYSPTCERITPDYQQLKGLQIKRGFRGRVAELFGGSKGCTHITELVGNIATGAIQTTAGQLSGGESRRPVSVDGCHALDASGPIVAKYYPQWHRKMEQKE